MKETYKQTHSGHQHTPNIPPIVCSQHTPQQNHVPVKASFSLSDRDERCFSLGSLSAGPTRLHLFPFVFPSNTFHHFPTFGHHSFHRNNTLHIWSSTCLFHQIQANPNTVPAKINKPHQNLMFPHFGDAPIHWQKGPAKNLLSFPRGHPKMAMPSSKKSGS